MAAARRQAQWVPRQCRWRRRGRRPAPCMSPTTRATPSIPGTPLTRRPSGRSRRSSGRRRRPDGWCTARPATAAANRYASPPGTPRSTPSCSSPHDWPARASAVTGVVWWVAGTAAAVVLVPCLVAQIRRCWAALVRRRRARLRAEALLWPWLSPAQRKQYGARRWFEVTTTSGRRYRVLRGGVVRSTGAGLATASGRPRRSRWPMRCWPTSCCWRPTSAASWPSPIAFPIAEQTARHCKARAALCSSMLQSEHHQPWQEDSVGLTLLTTPLAKGDRSTPPSGDHWPVDGWSAAGGPPAPALAGKLRGGGTGSLA
jgi:hypothetical protein